MYVIDALREEFPVDHDEIALYEKYLNFDIDGSRHSKTVRFQ